MSAFDNVIRQFVPVGVPSGKVFVKNVAHFSDRLQYSGKVVSALEVGGHSGSDFIPGSVSDFAMNTLIGDDLKLTLGEKK